MYRIVSKQALNPSVTRMEFLAPRIAAKAKAGQFVILRADEEGERIPLTVAGTDPERGTVEIIFQKVGLTTGKLDLKNVGDSIPDLVGPLGKPSEIEGLSKVCVIGGGVGCAIALPVVRALKRQGSSVTAIAGFRSRDLVILQEEFEACADTSILMTDDGTAGRKGNVCVPLEELLKAGERFDRIFAIGPLIMMKFAVASARPYGIPFTVSMNPIMIDGTGMCGGCRLSLVHEGKRVTRFACVDGPEFDGYEVDFDEAMTRNRMYIPFEREAACRLLKESGC